MNDSLELHVLYGNNRYVIKKEEHEQMFLELATDVDKLNYFKTLLEQNPLTAFNIYNNIETIE